MIENLKLWNSVEKTDPKKTKDATIGNLNITSINATSQIKEATSQWGSYGSKWGLRNILYSYMDIDTTKLALVSAEFYYPAGSFVINSSIKVAYITLGSSGYLKIDDDFMKKIETDITTKSLSKLGFNADIFMGLYDDQRYVKDLNSEFGNEPTTNNYQQNNKYTQGQSDGNIEWLSDESFQKAMGCGSSQKILATIQKYSSGSFKMKKDYREKMQNQIKILGN